VDVPITALAYFSVLAEELHYGNAAKRLHIAPPTLSQQITRLEGQLGVRLFERSPRAVTLTAAGKELQPLVEEARRAHRAVLDWAAAQNATEGPLLRVGIVATGVGSLTTRILAAVLQRIPGLRLEMRRLGFFDVPGAVVDGQVDVAFAPAPLRAAPQVRVVPIASEQRVLVVAKDHLLATRTSITIAETADEAFIAPGGDDAGALAFWLVDPRPDGTSPKRGPVADDIEGILALCAAGVGVNIAAASVQEHYARDGLAFVPIVDIPPASIVLVRLNAGADATAREFERVALEEAARP
jgi:DNA-binding transcriptional LysR family regulator